MNRFMTGTSLLLAAGIAGFAQAPTQFEVASIKPAAPQGGRGMMVMMRGGPGSNDPGHVTYTNVSLKNILMNAYGVKGYQISGPAWLDSERFDITAKVPEGATKESMKVMLQNMLKERFGLAEHRETKELPMYALVVGKNGPKLKEAEAAPAPADTSSNGGGPSAGGPAPAPAGGRGGFPAPPKMGKDGFPELPKGASPGSTMIMMGPQGHMRMSTVSQSMQGLADMLAGQLDRPVVDKTELKGKYDFNLDYMPEAGRMGGMPPPPPPPGGGGDGPVAGASDSEGPNIITAIQEQLGLKLEGRKGPVEILVIDKLEKTPTEN